MSILGRAFTLAYSAWRVEGAMMIGSGCEPGRGDFGRNSWRDHPLSPTRGSAASRVSPPDGSYAADRAWGMGEPRAGGRASMARASSPQRELRSAGSQTVTRRFPRVTRAGTLRTCSRNRCRDHSPRSLRRIRVRAA
jgi:hypothetical protein